MPAVLIGLGILALIAMGASRARARAPSRLPYRPVVTPPVAALPPPADSMAATDAADSVRGGTGTAEDYETLADEADRRGRTDLAARFRATAATSPESASVADAVRMAPTPPPAAPPAPSLPPDEPAEAIREGRGTAEDFEAVASDAERRGETEAAAALRERAAVAPERAAVEEAMAMAPTAPAAAPAPAAPPPAAPEGGPLTVVPTPAASIRAPEGPPEGFDPPLAARLARSVSADIKTRAYNYSRAGLRAFQRAAGIAPDGLYGGGSRGALRFYGIANPIRPLFAPRREAPYPTALAAAARTALGR